MQFKPKCLTTALGSLPFKDVDKAIDFVIKYFSNVPFWPQLPTKSYLEGMSIQFSENIPIIELEDKNLVLKEDISEKVLEEFYTKVINKDFEYFSISRDYAVGFHKIIEYLEKGLIKSSILKCHVTGPFTFSASIKQSKNKKIIASQEFLQIITSALYLKALWQIKKIKSFGKEIILFFDEPYLACFGSSLTPLDRNNVVATLRELVNPLKEEGSCLIGAHCCGNTDWPIFIESGFDIISFDAFNYLERVMLYTKELKAFLLSGGILALGIVPTQEFDCLKIELDLLLKKIEEGLLKFSAKGIDQSLVLEQTLLTPSCGMGTLNEDVTIKISNILEGLSFRLKKKYF
ncbi:MAG: hypothetical protein AB1755_04775 [Candidatus Omnitrophota bacterium]